MFEVNQLEAQLAALTHRNEALVQECSSREQEKAELARQLKELQDKIEGQPMQQVVSGKIYQPDLNFTLQEQISALSLQLTQSQTIQQQLQQEVAQQHMMRGQLERDLMTQKLQVSKLASDLEAQKANAAAKDTAVKNWRELLATSSQKRMRLNEEKEELVGRLKQAEERNKLKIDGIVRQIEAIAARPQPQGSERERDSEQEERVLELMREQLDDRNREINHLSSLCEQSKPVAGQDHLRNTIKHLKGQLVRYKSIASSITQKLLKADDTIKTYEDASQRCNLELRSLDGLVEKNKALISKCEDLEKELEAARGEVTAVKEERLKQLGNLKVIMEENQCLHEFVFESYGESAHQFIEHVRSAVEPRIRERERREQWASIDELIEVNSRLKARCKVA